MDTKQYLIALDQGTTSSRALLVDSEFEIIGIKQQEFKQIYPEKGWVEHDPLEIWNTQIKMMHQVMEQFNIEATHIAGIGITNQRETTVIWNKNTGKPIYNAIVWQDQRTIDICETLKAQGLTNYIKETTGLVIDTYFSACKIKWILDNTPGALELATKGELLFGTIDTWLLWKLTQGKVHATDYTNASRTMLFNIQTLKWDDKLLKVLNIPISMMPEVKPSANMFGYCKINAVSIPITGVAGDQQSSLFGQKCFSSGMAKNTYGTGCFALMNIGSKFKQSSNGLLTTLTCDTNTGSPEYAFEGSVFIAGAAVQWLRDGLEIIDSASETEKMAKSIKDLDALYFVPAFSGLGAPYWNMYVRGAIFGLTRDVTKNHLAKATLQAIAYQTLDVLNAMSKDLGRKIQNLKVDGGASNNNFLMQFQSDILNTDVIKPNNSETTAMGAIYLAAQTLGLWNRNNTSISKKTKAFTPNMDAGTRKRLYSGWTNAINTCISHHGNSK